MNFRATKASIDPVASWRLANSRYLDEALALIRGYLARRAKTSPGRREQSAAIAALAASAKAMTPPPAIETVTSAFGLSPFERNLLLLCAGVELDGALASSCAEAQNDPRGSHPTFRLALETLPDSHWSALAPSSPLRRFRLIEIEIGPTLTSSVLRIDERVLHFIAGLSQLDERLAAILEPVSSSPALPPSQWRIVEPIVALWRRAESPPIVQLAGSDIDGKRAVAAAACVELGLRLLALPAQLLGNGVDPQNFVPLFARETLLGRAALLLDCDDLDGADVSRAAAASRLLDRLLVPTVVTTRERCRLARRACVVFEVKKPTSAEQRALWNDALSALAPTSVAGPASPQIAPIVAQIAAQFDLSAAAIESVSAAARANPEPSADPENALWDACRSQARPKLDDLAQRIDGGADWDDLVLPEAQRSVLREIATHVRQRATVYETWGFAAKSARGLGVSALFSGPSGTGKTMTAEVLAKTLKLDLYRIDLSCVVSKYIGETEKNLRRIFDAAEEGAAILLFDEADAIFGKRSEVKDSHDRYANIEVSYLLQRMEAYRGLAILTTNMKGALDPAFLRRIRFLMQFPFPDAEQRAEIWRRAFPPATPTQGLDLQKLSRLNVSGGNIRNIAINAAFLAVAAGGPVRMAEIMQAARSEYGKMERPLTRELED